jgi:hypothetical protein
MMHIQVPDTSRTYHDETAMMIVMASTLRVTAPDVSVELLSSSVLVMLAPWARMVGKLKPVRKEALRPASHVLVCLRKIASLLSLRAQSSAIDVPSGHTSQLQPWLGLEQLHHPAWSGQNCTSSQARPSILPSPSNSHDSA